MNIIEQANEHFKNVFLNEMAFSREDVIKKISAKSETIMEHLIKCVVYENTTNDLEYWIDEIATNLSRINFYEAKTKTSRLEYNDYLENVFYKQGSTERDMKSNLWDFEDNKNYPNFTTTNELAHKLFVVFKFLAENCCEIFVDKNNTFEKVHFKGLIKDALEQVGIY